MRSAIERTAFWASVLSRVASRSECMRDEAESMLTIPIIRIEVAIAISIKVNAPRRPPEHRIPTLRFTIPPFPSDALGRPERVAPGKALRHADNYSTTTRPEG